MARRSFFGVSDRMVDGPIDMRRVELRELCSDEESRSELPLIERRRFLDSIVDCFKKRFQIEMFASPL
jgi:hypothetical protein